MRVDPSSIFDRLVLNGCGYGSYCYGQNGLLLGILRRLGYRYGRTGLGLLSQMLTCMFQCIPSSWAGEYGPRRYSTAQVYSNLSYGPHPAARRVFRDLFS